MNAGKEIRRTNAWVNRRIKPTRPPLDEGLIMDYEFQMPSQWRENLETWAGAMLIVIVVAFVAGYAMAFI